LRRGGIIIFRFKAGNQARGTIARLEMSPVARFTRISGAQAVADKALAEILNPYLAQHIFSLTAPCKKIPGGNELA
jgi:hypothetical protein